MQHYISRRQLLSGLGAGAAALALNRPASAAPAAPVAIGKCKTYGAELVPALDRMFDL